MVGILLVTGLLERMTLGLKMLVLASGRVRGLQLSSGFLKASSMLLLCCLLREGTPFLLAVGIAWILPQIGIASSRIWFARQLLQLDLFQFLRTTVAPIFIYLGISIAFGVAFRRMVGPSFWWVLPFFALNATLVLVILLPTYPDPTVRELPKRISSMISRGLLGR